MRSPEYISHGTSSEKSSEKIQEEGFHALEGRATVSADLIYSFTWATRNDKHRSNKRREEIQEGEQGRMIIMKVPETQTVNYGTDTGIEIDEEKKEISGFSSKYESGRRQLAMYDGDDFVGKKREIEQAKQEKRGIERQRDALLTENGINPDAIRSQDGLIEAMQSLPIAKQKEILQQYESFESLRREKGKIAAREVEIQQENILMSIEPTPELGAKLEEMRIAIKNFEKIDLKRFTEETSVIIEKNKKNSIAPDADIRSVIGTLLKTTLETEVVKTIRSLAMDVKKAQGYTIYNRGKDEIKPRDVDLEELKERLLTIQALAGDEHFDIGMESLNRYVRANTERLLGELDQQERPATKQEISPEKVEELRVMKERIGHSLENEGAQEKVTNDFLYTFEQLGLPPERAKELCDDIFTLLKSDKPLPDIEDEILLIFENITLNVGDTEQNLVDILHEKLKDRAKIIASQVAPHLEDVRGRTIDYGAGDGQVTQLLHDQLGLDIEGVDVRLYPALNVTVPIKSFDGNHVEVEDGTYEAALLTNVLHHEKDNENILDELDRIVRGKLVILETVPVGETEETMEQDKDRTFMNDYLYNRLFHSADVPVPGTYETPRKWVDRLAEHGWTLSHEEDLGFDQPTIKDRHYLLTFEK